VAFFGGFRFVSRVDEWAGTSQRECIQGCFFCKRWWKKECFLKDFVVFNIPAKKDQRIEVPNYDIDLSNLDRH
jgi:hypothetical protein